MYGIYDGTKVTAEFVTPMTVRSNQPVFSSDTLSLKRQTSVQGAQRWEITTQLMPLSHTAEDLFVDFVTKGHSETTYVIMPQNYGAIQRRTSNSAPTAKGNRHERSVTIQNNLGLIPKGTFIKFAGHSKIYLTTTDIQGPGAVGIFPSLIKDVEDEVMLHRDDVVMPCLYDTSTVSGMAYTDGILMDNGSITLIERL